MLEPICFLLIALAPILGAVEDPRNFDRMFRNLINNDVRRGPKYKLSAAEHPSACPPKIGEILQTGTSFINGSSNPGTQPGGYPSQSAHKCVRDLPPLAATNESPSGSQKPMESLTNLIMGEVFAPL
jgi:hypothetical protein